MIYDLSEKEPPWIVDSHTHILPPRLASKIRSYFKNTMLTSSSSSSSSSSPPPPPSSSDGQDHTPTTITAAATTTGGDGSNSNSSSSSSGGGGGGGGGGACCDDGSQAASNQLFDQTFSHPIDFPNHDSLQLQYHPSDPNLIVSHQLQSNLSSCWILPYAHKAGMAFGLNQSMVTIGKAIENCGLQKAVVGFTIHPKDGKEKVEECTKRAILEGARVAKLHCSVGGYDVREEDLQPFWILAGQIGFPVVVHAGTHHSGNTVEDELTPLDIIAKTYPQAKIIIAHSGAPSVKRALEIANENENVYLDTTPTVTRFPSYPLPNHPQGYHTILVSLAKRGKILFGTDVPNTALTIDTQLQAIFSTFALQEFSTPNHPNWWREKQQAEKAGEAVLQVLGKAATKLLEEIDISTLTPDARM